jgi:hypothetical protein
MVFLVIILLLIVYFSCPAPSSRNLTDNEKKYLRKAIDIIKNDTNYVHIGYQIESLMNQDRFMVVPNFLRTSIQGAVFPTKILYRKIYLSPNILNSPIFSIYDLVEVIIHEYIHYKQNTSIPVIIQPVVGWYSILDKCYQIILDDRDNKYFFPFSFEDGAHKVGRKIRRDLETQN